MTPDFGNEIEHTYGIPLPNEGMQKGSVIGSVLTFCTFA